MSTVAAITSSITQQLRALGRGSRQGHRPSAQSDFGVATPELRKLVRQWSKSIKAESADFIQSLALSLLNQNVTECRQVGYELLSRHKAGFQALTESKLTELARGLDNWACVDLYSTYLLGPAWNQRLVSDAYVVARARSGDMWLRRAAMVATVPLNQKSRGGSGDAERTLLIAELLVCDGEELVQKAVSWALRVLVPWDREAVEGFIAAHELPARVLRELRNKLSSGTKSGR